MSVKRPTPEQIMDIVDSFGMNMTPERVGEFLSLMEGNFAAYDLINQMPDEIPVVKYPRTPGYRPGPEENPYNAWYVKTEFWARRPASSRARRWRSRTTSASPACR